MAATQKITSCLWFDGCAEEAAAFYVSVFPDSRIDQKIRTAIDTPGAKAGAVILVDFTVAGQSYQALNGGAHDSFNDAISLVVHCEDQAEVDRLWDGLTANGGRPIACGWLKDKFGVSWQIVPEAMMDMMKDPDPNKAKRVMEAMMQMVKLDIDKLETGLRRVGLVKIPTGKSNGESGRKSMSYVDGFVAAVPSVNREEFRKHAEVAAYGGFEMLVER